MNGVALFDAFDVQRGSIFLNASEMMGDELTLPCILCCAWRVANVTVSADDDNEDDIANRQQIRITVVAAEADAHKISRREVLE